MAPTPLAATQAGTRLRLAGNGIPNVSGRGRGDLYVRIQVAVPRTLTDEQRAILETLKHELPAAADAVPAGQTADTDSDRPCFDRVKDIFG